MSRKILLFEAVDEGPEWVATFIMSQEEFDDSIEDTSREEILYNAIDFNTAVKYAQQYLKKMQMEEETADIWQNAEITSVELH